MIDKLKVIEDSSAQSVITAGAMSYHVTEYSLESYCSLIRFLYTGIIDLQVDLNDFAIGALPTKPYSLASKERPAVEGLFTSTPSPGSDAGTDVNATKAWPLVRATTPSEPFRLSDCYQLQDLRAHCRTQILGDMNVSNALDVLFGFANCSEDSKNVVLNFVAENLDKIFGEDDDEDPFEKYKDHPPRVPVNSSHLLTGLGQIRLRRRYRIVRYDLACLALARINWKSHP